MQNNHNSRPTAKSIALDDLPDDQLSDALNLRRLLRQVPHWWLGTEADYVAARNLTAAGLARIVHVWKPGFDCCALVGRRRVRR